MAKYTRKRASGRRSRRSWTRRKAVSTNIIRTIKRINLKQAETKKLLYNVSTTVANNGMKSWNIMHSAAQQGTDNHQFIGNKFYLKGIKVKAAFSNTNPVGGIYFDAPVTCKIMVVACKEYKTITNLVAADIYETTTLSQNHYNGIIDSSKCRVLSSRKVTLQSGYAGQRIMKTANVWAKYNKSFTFKNFTASTESKGWNLYVLAIAYSGDSTVNTVCNLDYNFEVYFKDE